MVRISRENLLFLIIGTLIGVVLTMASGVAIYKIIKNYNQPKRYADIASGRFTGRRILPKIKKRLSQEGFEIFVASSLDRVFQDGATLLKPSFGQSASISLAKNEYESFQIVINNGKHSLKSVALEISDFINEETQSMIDSQNITWRVVGYVETKRPYYPVKFVGMWPDPLLAAAKIDINPGFSQPFWITVYAPPQAQAGIYRGSIRVVSDKLELKNIPVRIEIFNFTLPLESHLKTAFDFYPHITAKRYPQREKETDLAYSLRILKLNDSYLIDLLKHRMNPILNIDPLSQPDLALVDRYRRYGLNNFSIGKRGGTFNNNWPKEDKEIERLFMLYRSYGEALKINKMLRFHYIYTWDEGQIGNERLKKVSSMIHRAHPELKNMVCYHGFWDPENNPGWGEDIDIWCFQIDSFNEQKMRKLQKQGMEIWMYVSGPSGSGSPNLAIDFDSIDYRIIPWLCWKYEIKGFLYWCVNWWPFADPFQSAANTEWEDNGNGLLYYPGANDPINSLRIEIFRDGMEDFEYLYLLAGKINSLKEKDLLADYGELIREASETLEIGNSIAASMVSFTKDSNTLLSRRDRIARLIEKLSEVKEYKNVRYRR